MKNRNFISINSLFDEDTGEVITERSRVIKCPEKVVLSMHFSKLSTRATQELNAKELGYLAKLSNNLEYETNRLVIMENGKRNKPIKMINIKKIFKLSVRRTEEHIKNFKRKGIIFKIKNEFFINPSYINRSTKFDVEILKSLLKYDQSIGDYICEKDVYKLKKFLPQLRVGKIYKLLLNNLM